MLDMNLNTGPSSTILVVFLPPCKSLANQSMFGIQTLTLTCQNKIGKELLMIVLSIFISVSIIKTSKHWASSHNALLLMGLHTMY